MPDPTPTDRDRELALEIVKGAINGRFLVERITKGLAQARREGRKEAQRQYGFQEGQRVGLEAAIRELKRLTNDLEERALPLRRLPDQPAPPRAKE